MILCHTLRRMYRCRKDETRVLIAVAATVREVVVGVVAVGVVVAAARVTSVGETEPTTEGGTVAQTGETDAVMAAQTSQTDVALAAEPKAAAAESVARVTKAEGRPRVEG